MTLFLQLVSELAGGLLQEEALMGFYKGWATNMLRTVPAAAITFTSFELFARLLREAGAQQRAKKEHKQAVVSEVGG